MNTIVEYTEREKSAVQAILNPDSHQTLLRLVMDAEPKKRLTHDEADSMSLIDWVSLIKDEIGILRTSDDSSEIFRAFHQIRYLSTQALLANARADLDAGSWAA